MHLENGSDIAVVVHGKWHSALCSALTLTDAGEEDSRIVYGKLSDFCAHVGVWIAPEETYAAVGLSLLFIPWQAIISVAMVIAPKRTALGFATK